MVADLFRVVTNEGLVSQIRQLSFLTDSFRSYQNFHLTPIHSIHYNYQSFCILDYIDVYSYNHTFSCTNKTLSEINSISLRCKMQRNSVLKQWEWEDFIPLIPTEYWNTPNATLQVGIKQVLTFGDIGRRLKRTKSRYHCVGGFIYFYRVPLFKIPSFSFEFKVKYYEIFQQMMTFMHTKQHEYTVIHWRRGDQLSTRCISQLKEKIKDTSINCGHVRTFINVIKKTQKRQYGINFTEPIYIATNEQNNKSLEWLHKAGFYTLQNFSFIKLQHPVECAILDIIMMMNAKYLYGSGRTALHGFIRELRKYYGYKPARFFSLVDNPILPHFFAH